MFSAYCVFSYMFLCVCVCFDAFLCVFREALLRFREICDGFVRRCFGFEEYVGFTSPLWPGVRPQVFFPAKHTSPDFRSCFYVNVC